MLIQVQVQPMGRALSVAAVMWDARLGRMDLPHLWLWGLRKSHWLRSALATPPWRARHPQLAYPYSVHKALLVGGIPVVRRPEHESLCADTRTCRTTCVHLSVGPYG